ETERWLVEAEHWALTPHERLLIGRARGGHRRFWGELEQIAGGVPIEQAPSRVRQLIEQVLVPEVLGPAHAYLDFNEEEVEEAVDKSQAFADRLVYALLFLTTCGSAAGLVAG